jgi:hypothetical protein
MQEDAGGGWLGSDEIATYNALVEYPPLADPAEWLSRQAAERSREISGGPLLLRDGFFRNRREFTNWLHLRTYWEALRLVLEPRRVEAELLRLPRPGQRRLLQWVYADQLTDYEVARVRGTPGDLIGGEAAAAARSDCQAAYDALCERLQAVFPDDEAPTVFPLFL